MEMNGRNGIFLVALEYINAQTHSPLFKLPRELRDKIYKLAFTSPEQTEQLKDGRPHFHPPYLSQRTANPSLLQSCKRAYTEAWSIWWITTQHTLWLSASTTSIDATPPTWLADMLGLLKQHHYRYELDNVRFVGQTAESSEQPHQLPLSKFLALPDFHPVTITIVVRHVDWPGWQCCEHLRISGMLPRLYSFPSSVRQITLELETLESKVDQLAEIVQAMKLQWCFSTVDCAKLTAVRAPIVMQIWHGSSTWAGKRWARDESEPEVVHYIVALVKFEHEHHETGAGLLTNPDLSQIIEPPGTAPIGPVLNVTDLEDAQVPPGTDGYVAYQMVKQYWSQLTIEHRKKQKQKPSGWRSWFWD